MTETIVVFTQREPENIFEDKEKVWRDVPASVDYQGRTAFILRLEPETQAGDEIVWEDQGGTPHLFTIQKVERGETDQTVTLLEALHSGPGLRAFSPDDLGRALGTAVSGLIEHPYSASVNELNYSDTGLTCRVSFSSMRDDRLKAWWIHHRVEQAKGRETFPKR